MSSRTILILGSGSWGTALAHHLARGANDVTIWGRDTAALAAINDTHRNPAYFGDLPLDPRLKATENLAAVARSADMIVFAVPSGAVRSVAGALRPLLGESRPLVVSTAKGLETGSNLRMTDVLAAELPTSCRIAVLSGPSFAKEVIAGVPTAVTMAASSEETASDAGAAFHFDNLRIYRSTDVVGVELGGVLKNVIALAVGLLDGAAIGANARAALVTRGLAEMQRLIVACGGQPMTVVGLSGLGDLLLTSTGDLSRNRQVGLRLGRGEKLEDVVRELGQVAEAVTTTAAARALAAEKSIDMPIVDQVAEVLAATKTVPQAISALLSRAPAKEFRQ